MFGTLLRELRMKRKITQIELAQAIGVSNGNVGDWERGRSKPGYDALAALSRFFEISPEYLLELDSYSASKELLRDDSFSQMEIELVKRLRRLEKRDQEIIFEFVTTLSEKSERDKWLRLLNTYRIKAKKRPPQKP